jgi:hypothetical protein
MKLGVLCEFAVDQRQSISGSRSTANLVQTPNLQIDSSLGEVREAQSEPQTCHHHKNKVECDSIRGREKDSGNNEIDV